MNYDQIDSLEKELERLLNWIGAAESRLAFVLSVSTAMAGALAISLPGIFHCSAIIRYSTFLAISLLFLSIVFVACASFPRTRGPTKSLIYFGSIDKLTLEEFSDSLHNRTGKDYANDLLEQCHRNAQIATLKFSWIQKAMICIFASIFPWVVSMFNSVTG